MASTAVAGTGRPRPTSEWLCQAAHQIRPLDAQGQPSEAGKIGLSLCRDVEHHPGIPGLPAPGGPGPGEVRLGGARATSRPGGGMDSLAWANPQQLATLRWGQPDPWTVLDQRLEQAGVTDEQVQVAWVKLPDQQAAARRIAEARRGPRRRTWPSSSQNSRRGSPTCGSPTCPAAPTAGTPPAAEPRALRLRGGLCGAGLIQDQIQGDAGLNHDPDGGAVKARCCCGGRTCGPTG